MKAFAEEDIHITPREKQLAIDHQTSRVKMGSGLGSSADYSLFNYCSNEKSRPASTNLEHYRGRLKNIKNKKVIHRKQVLKGLEDKAQILENHFLNISGINGDQDSEVSIGNFESSDEENPYQLKEHS